jgi:hypothetical protein
MIWIVFFLLRLAEAEHWQPARRAAGKEVAEKSVPEAVTPLTRLFHAMGYRHASSQSLLALSFLGFLGFLGCVPGWEGMLVFHCFFALFIVANLVERIASGPEAAGQSAVRNIRRRQWSAAGLVIALAVLTRVFLLGFYVVSGNSAAPEIPGGSHIVVWKKSRSFVPGDMVAYRADDNAHVGRVVHVESGRIRVNRNGRPDEVIPRSQVIGKVISVYWRGAAEPQEGADERNPAVVPPTPPQAGTGGAGVESSHAVY